MNKMTIEDVCTFSGGSQPPKSEFVYEETEGYIRLIQTRDYKTDRFLTYIPETSAKKLCDETDVMIGRYGPPVFQILRGLKGAYNVALMKAIPKDNILKDYLYYLLKQDSIFRYVDALSSRTGGQTGVDIDSLNKYPVMLPDIPYQQKVVDLLKGIDDKIETNNSIRKKYEEMFYRKWVRWFINFEFPDKEGKPYRSNSGKMRDDEKTKRELPEGWINTSLDYFCTIGTESVNPFECPNEDFLYYNIPDFDKTGTYSLSKGDDIKSNKYAVKPNDILVSKLNPWFNRVIIVDEDAIASTEFVDVKTVSNQLRNFFYVISISEGFISYCSSNATGTSNSHKRVDPEIMLKYKINFNKEIAYLFGQSIDEEMQYIIKIVNENKALIELRDSLLPKLMNGQLKIK